MSLNKETKPNQTKPNHSDLTMTTTNVSIILHCLSSHTMESLDTAWQQIRNILYFLQYHPRPNPAEILTISTFP